MGKRILVVDDDLDVLEAIEAALKYEGYETFKVGRTYNIFNTINHCKPDLIMVDFVLEGATGGEICLQVKKNPETEHIPIIIISAYPQSDEALKEFGCNAFIPKPFSLDDLYLGIHKCLADNKGRSEAD